MPDQDRSAQGPTNKDPMDEALARLLDEAAPPRAIVPPSPGEVEAALTSVLARRAANGAGKPVVSLDAYRARWHSARMRAAAAVLVVAGVGLVWRTASQGRAPEAASPAARFATGAGGLDSIRLSDGSQVLLGPGSTLTVAAGFDGSAREVSLTGDARFTVVHDEARPFLVRTTAATFRDIGTVFVVHGSSSGARVAVTEGAVAMAATGGKDSVVLRAGDRASVAPGGAVSVQRAAATADDVAWTSGRLVLRDVSVGRAVADLRRWYGMELRVDPALVAHTVSATFERGTPPGDVARVVAALLGGGVQEEGGTYRIVAPPGVVPPR